MPTTMKEKYLNWLSLIETDYITMFIKTWFTFLASLQELVDPERETSRDRETVEKYRKELFNTIDIKINEEFIKNVLNAYSLAKDNVLSSNTFLMKDYFEIFYSFNEDYSDTFSYTYRGKVTELHLKVVYSKRKKKTLKIILNDERKKFKEYFDEKIETGFSLSEKVKSSKIFEEKRKFIDEILSAIKEKSKEIIDGNKRLDERGRRMRMDFLNDECLKDIERELNEKLDIKSVFPLRPNNSMADLDVNTLEIKNKPQFFDEDLTRWFVDFSYKLRNILFHFIIDPMNKDWQSLFKYTYLVLKHLTEENIKVLKIKDEV